MIKIFKKDKSGLVRLDAIEKNSWVMVTNPHQEEIGELCQETGIPHEFFIDPLDIDERAHMEVDEGSILMIVRTPIYDETDIDTPFMTLPLGIIKTKDLIVTVCSHESPVIEEFLAGKVRQFFTEKKNHFVLMIFNRVAMQFLRHLREINKRSAIAEKELHSAMRNQELIKLLNIEKSLVYFTTALRSNELMMERLYRSNHLKLTEDEKDILEDVMIDNKQAIQMTNIYSNILSGMMDAFASIINNNLNVVMRLLTTVTIILMLPTLVASIYGMNIVLPFQNSAHAFIITMGMSFILSLVGIIIFWKKKWF